MRVAERAQQSTISCHRCPSPAVGTPDGAQIRAGCLPDPQCCSGSELMLRDTSKFNVHSQCFHPVVHRVPVLKSVSHLQRASAAETLHASCPGSEHALSPLRRSLQTCSITSRQDACPQHHCVPRVHSQPRNSRICSLMPTRQCPADFQYSRHTTVSSFMSGNRDACTLDDQEGNSSSHRVPRGHLTLNDEPRAVPRDRQASPKLTEAVFSSDAISSIMHHGSASEIAAMRLTCRSWRRSISMRVRKLKPRAVPLGPGPLNAFPAVLELDLTAIGPQRMRALYPLLETHAEQITQLTLGDKEGRASWMANRDLAKLARMTCLRSLALRHPKSVNAQGFSHLKALTDLEDLQLVKCKCIDDSLAGICSAWPRLTRLGLIDCKGTVSNTGSMNVKTPHQLGYLHLSKASLAVMGIHLSNPSRLECMIGFPDLGIAATGDKPMDLHANHGVGLCAGLNELAHFTKLRNLVIEEMAFPSLTQLHALSRLSLLTGLTCLSLNNVTPFSCIRDVLFGVTWLCSLTLSNTGGFPRPCQGLEQTLGHMCQLRDLDLTGLAVSWAVLFANVGLTSLAMTAPRAPHQFLTMENQPRIQLKRLKILAVCDSQPLPACLSKLTAMTYLSLSPAKQLDHCGGQSRLFASLRILLPHLKLQQVDLSLPINLELLSMLRSQAPEILIKYYAGQSL